MRLKAALKLDLPSQQVYSQPGSIARFFGSQSVPTGSERVVGDTLSVLDCFVRAYHAMSVTNVIALKIDQKPIYLDNGMVQDDLGQMIAALNAHRQVLTDAFQIIHLVMEHEAAGIHYVMDTKIRGHVSQGEEEVYVVVSGKIGVLNPLPQEAAAAYRKRIRDVMITPGFMAGYQQQFSGAVAHILQQLQQYTGALSAGVEYVEMGVTRPSKDSLRQLGRQSFRQQSVAFRGAPVTSSAAGYYHDPYSYYYYNPYDAYMDIVIIDALLSQSAPGLPPDTVLYNYNGHSLGQAAHVEAYQDQLTDVGQFASDEAVAKLESGELGQEEYLAGYGGEDLAQEGSFDAGDAGYFDGSTDAKTGESCSAASSCSSSSCSSGSSCSSCSSCS